MSLTHRLKYRIAFALCIVIFAVLKLPALDIPYFWDELGVYVPGMRAIADHHTLGILPGDLDPLFSRGHPLLFYFVGATTFKIFGDSVMAGHLLSILIAVCTLIVFYRMCESLYNECFALCAVLLLAVQPVFFAMAGILLPEMLLTLFTVLAVWGILAQRWVLFAVGGSLALLTKEAGILLPVLASIILFIDAIKARDFFTLKRWKLFLAGITPLLVYGVFLLIQKLQNGWYFFPEHVGLIHIYAEGLYRDGKNILYQLFLDQGRWFLLLVLAAGLLLAGSTYFSLKNRRRLLICWVFMLISSFFCAINFFLARYHLYIFPFFILVCVMALESIRIRYHIQKPLLLFAPVMAIAILLSSVHMDRHKFNDTYDMSYATTVNGVRDCIAWVETQTFRNAPLHANFPIGQSIEDKRNGYTNHHFDLKKFEEKAQYLLGFYLEGQTPDNPWKYDSVVKRFDREFAHIVVMTYKIKSEE